MRPLTSGVFQWLMAGAFLEIDAVSRDSAGGGPPAAQNHALGPLRGRGAGGRARNARARLARTRDAPSRAALCGAGQRDRGEWSPTIKKRSK
jgi:hypothetical protein